jgi:hypothetical protein
MPIYYDFDPVFRYNDNPMFVPLLVLMEFFSRAIALSPPQSDPAASELSFKTDVTLVSVDAQVIDRRDGNPMTNLGCRDFELYEDGSFRPIAACTHDAVPLDLVLVLLLNPPEPRDRQPRATQRHLRTLIGDLGKDDRLGIITFGSRPVVFLQPSSNTFAAIGALGTAMAARRPAKSWRIYDALIAATNLFSWKWSPLRRRSVLVVFDRPESKSHAASTQVLTALLEKNSLLFGAKVNPRSTSGLHLDVGPPIGRAWEIGGRKAISVNTEQLEEIAGSSGGEIRSGTDALTLLADSFERIRRTYRLYFYAMQGAHSGNRQIVVSLSPDARKKHPHAIVRGSRVYHIAP